MSSLGNQTTIELTTDKEGSTSRRLRLYQATNYLKPTFRQYLEQIKQIFHLKNFLHFYIEQISQLSISKSFSILYRSQFYLL